MTNTPTAELEEQVRRLAIPPPFVSPDGKQRYSLTIEDIAALIAQREQQAKQEFVNQDKISCKFIEGGLHECIVNAWNDYRNIDDVWEEAAKYLDALLGKEQQ